MLINPSDASTIISEAVQADESKVKASFGGLTAAAMHVANDESLLLPDRAQLLDSATQLLQDTIRGIVPGTVPALATAPAVPVAALGGGDPSAAGTPVDPADEAILASLRALASSLGVSDAATLVSNIAAMFAPIITDPVAASRSAKMVAMAMVADGSIPLAADGSVDHSMAVSAVQTELDNERNPLSHGTLAFQLAEALRDFSSMETQKNHAIDQRNTALGTLREANDPAIAGSLAHQLAQAMVAAAPAIHERDELQACFRELDTLVSSDRRAHGQVKRVVAASGSNELKALVPHTLA